MTVTALTGISQLVTNDPAHDHAEAASGPLGVVRDAAVVLDGDRVLWSGPAANLPSSTADVVVDLGGRAVVPGFVDSHNHLAFAGDRSDEFAARMAGESYSAGGIRSTVAHTRAASDADLAGSVRRLADEALRQGTTTIESKSGYGLSVDDERRSLEAIGTVTREGTFLGAHVVPADHAGRADEYVALVAGEMLDACAPLAKWIDVFCDVGAFDVDQSREILTAGIAAGLLPRIHAGQLAPGGGIQLAVELGAASADHVTHATDDDVEALAGSTTVATLLPGAEFSTRAVYPDARRLLAAGVTVALAADCNPGSSYTTSLPFCIAVAVRDMGMTPAEALWSATAGGAAALRRTDVGHLAVGAAADLVVLDAPSFVHLAYRPGVPLVEAVWRGGVRVAGRAS
ncbi:imidazolonepropionase [Frigoribacterium faeni]|uniref:Imidazolonepropionase n=1 Tax=Frigoribacterium faeni TaxID=145483 RepID=A0A7W3JJ52_9MICO|nr:imidazolonepropionase [Frigoribacterium faeni]MBA8813785.1 imidazolonepropionase [Frigoribacterium faeni]GEK84312.1 imidazolonepropionase [Frigoribacterium faeni]